jgi:hypothetical protein
MKQQAQFRIDKPYYDVIKFLSHKQDNPITDFLGNIIKEYIDNNHKQVLDLFKTSADLNADLKTK